jgi:hypothetical protein
MFWDVVVVLNLLETFDLWDFNVSLPLSLS